MWASLNNNHFVFHKLIVCVKTFQRNSHELSCWQEYHSVLLQIRMDLFSLTCAMEVSSEMFRFYVFTEMKREKSPKKIHEHLLNVWGRNTPSYDSVCRWIRDFQSKERESFSDMPRSGRPSTVGNDDSVALVKQLVDEDPHISVREISIQTGISIGSDYVTD